MNIDGIWAFGFGHGYPSRSSGHLALIFSLPPHGLGRAFIRLLCARQCSPSEPPFAAGSTAAPCRFASPGGTPAGFWYSAASAGVLACGSGTIGFLFQLFRHAEMLLQMGQRLRRPTLEISIIPALAIGFEQGDRIAMSLDLHLIVGLVELLAVLGL
jgi:hypothetical protein